MNTKCFDCIHFRCNDGCRWCEESHNMSACVNCGHFVKRLSAVEVQRVTNLQSVWDYLYRNKQYKYCDAISVEVGIIKGTLSEDDISKETEKVAYEL